MSVVLDSARGMAPRSELYRALARIDELRAELAEANERLQDWTGKSARLALMEAGFTRGQAYMIASMLHGRPTPIDTMVEAMRDAMRTPDNTDMDNVAKVQVCLIRKRAAKLGAPPFFKTLWGEGYALTPEALAWLRERAPRAFEKGATR